MKRTDDYKKRKLETDRLRRQNVSDEKRCDRLEKDRLRITQSRENEMVEAYNDRLQKDKRRKYQKRRTVVYDNGDFNFFDNFDKPTKDCKSYYKHNQFVNSHNDNDWEKAETSEMFGYQRMKGYQSLELFWNKKSGECGAMYLDGESAVFLKKCCGPLKAEREDHPTGFGHLPPLLWSIKKAMKEEPIHMTKYAQTYNNLLSFGSVGVDNKRGGGFENGFKGPHAATINGRKYNN